MAQPPLGSSAREDGAVKRFPKELITVLEPALTAARAALNDLDPDDVPASLRRVVAHSGLRLTPPLAAKLIDELDSLEWLRNDALELLDGDASDPARAYLERGDGWWLEVTSAVAEARTSSSARTIDTLEQQAAKQREAVEAAKAKLKHQRVEAKDALTALRHEVKKLRKAAAAEERAGDFDRNALERRIAHLEGERDEARDDLTGADTMLEDLRRRFREQRRTLADARRQLDAGVRSSVAQDPEARARELDLIAASVPRRQPDESTVPAASSEPAERLAIPAGIRPDRAEAVEWLLRQDGVTVIVDGYNLLFQLEPGEFTSGRARRRLASLMGHFSRKAAGRARIRVVFDSALPGQRNARSTADGVEVTFADSDRLADEEVVLLAAATAGPVVVVSSDREVREAAGEEGAVVLWSEAFVDWIGDQPVATPPTR